MLNLIARSWNHPRLDKLMIIASDPYKWLWPTLIFALFLIYYDWEFGLRAILLGGVSAGIGDGINARFIKPNTDRIRPGKQFPDIRSLGTMNKGKKSFPSNHASNTISFAASIGLFFPWAALVLFPLSFIVGYSRVYCGAHFPLDVLAGWLHGSFWVLLLYVISGLLF